MREHQRLGEMLRKDYIDRHVIPEVYNESEVQVYSTDRNRTLTSALSQLFGMYPLGKGPTLPNVDKRYHLPPYSSSNDSSESFALPKGHQPITITIDKKIVPSQCPN